MAWSTIPVLAVSFQDILDWTVTWLVGPALLVAMFMAGFYLTQSISGDPPKPKEEYSRYSEDWKRYQRRKKDSETSRMMAFAAGILGGLIVIIRDVLVKQVSFPDSLTDTDRTTVYVAGFLVVGFVVTLISAHIKLSITSSLLIFTLVATSVAATYFYFTQSDVRGTILISASSLGMGVLICLWWVPSSRHAFLTSQATEFSWRPKAKITN